jgi:hypothetical protein
MCSNLSYGAPGTAKKLYALAKASLPGYLRFGGGGADTFAYEIPGGPTPYLNCSALPPLRPTDDSDNDDGTGHSAQRVEVRAELGKQPPHCLNTSWLLNLLELADYSGAKLIFGLDINARDEATGRWDPSPARALIQFATAHNHKFAGFELGNGERDCSMDEHRQALSGPEATHTRWVGWCRGAQSSRSASMPARLRQTS